MKLLKIKKKIALILAICSIFLLVSISYYQIKLTATKYVDNGLTEIKSSSIAEQSTIIRPNGDYLTEWDGSPTPHWSRIDEYETSPDGIFVIWINGDENQSEIFDMTNSGLQDRTTVKIEVYMYGFRYYTGAASVSIYLGYWTETRQVPFNTNYHEWISCSWDNLQAPYSSLVNLQVNITASTWCSGDGYCEIDVLYAKVYYNIGLAIPGYNIFLLMGIISLVSIYFGKRRIK